MPGRLPTSADFSPHLTLSIHAPSKNQKPTNILILLHGLGDTHTPFARLALQLNLPETAYICVQAPSPLPDALGLGREGWHWGDDIVLDNSTGAVDLVDVPYTASTRILLDEVILGTLLRKCGYGLRDIMVYGFGQGGTAALSVGCELAQRPVQLGQEQSGELAGVISIGGPLPSTYKPGVDQVEKSKTPVLVLHGSASSAINASAIGAIKGNFENVEVHRWKKMSDSMPGSREEMLPIMRFFARRLRSLAGVPDGAVEIR